MNKLINVIQFSVNINREQMLVLSFCSVRLVAQTSDDNGNQLYVDFRLKYVNIFDTKCALCHVKSFVNNSFALD